MTDKLRELAAKWKRRASLSNGKGDLAFASNKCARELLAILDAEGDVRKDAERWRFLRDRAWDGFMRVTKDGPSLNCDEPWREWDRWIDAAIDAAMQGATP